MFEDNCSGCLRNKGLFGIRVQCQSEQPGEQSCWTNTNYPRSKAVYLNDLLKLTPQSQGVAAQTVDKATELLPENLRPYSLILNVIYSVKDIFHQSKEDSFKLGDYKTN